MNDASGAVSGQPRESANLTVIEVARRLRIPPKTVYRLLARGAIHGRKVDRTWRIAESELSRLPRDTLDVSRPKSVNAATLNFSREQLQTVLQSVAGGVMVQNAAGDILYANDTAARLCGYPSSAALLATPLAEVLDHFVLFDEQGKPLAREQLPAQRAFRGEAAPSSLVCSRTAATGEEQWATVQARPVFDERGALQFVVSAFQDVTALKRREAAEHFLAEVSHVLSSSLDYETTIARLVDLMLPELADCAEVHIIDPSGQVRQLAVAGSDPAQTALLGELRRRYPLSPAAKSGIAGVLRGGRAEVHWTITDEQVKASAIDRAHLALLRDLGLTSRIVVPLIAGGRTLGALSLTYTISHRRYLPADLALAEEVARRAAMAVENARLYREEQEALRMRDAFLSAVSHDLRTPLTSIKGLSQYLLRRARRSETLDGAQVAERLAEIDRSVDRMTAMIEELLDLVRSQSGRAIELHRQTVDLVPLARQVAAEAQRLAPAHQIAVVASSAELIGAWDRTRLERILANLLSNAVKYSPEGGAVTVTLATLGEAGSPGQRATIAVRDQGVGIPAADLPYIFGLFRRGANVAGRIPGIGIGLTGVQRIVREHGGHVGVESAENAGTTVTVTLPIAPEAVDPKNSTIRL